MGLHYILRTAAVIGLRDRALLHMGDCRAWPVVAHAMGNLMHGMHMLGRVRQSLRARRSVGLRLRINGLGRVIGLRRRLNILRRRFIRLRGIRLRSLGRHHNLDVNLRLGDRWRGKSESGNARQSATGSSHFQNKHNELLKRETRSAFV